MRKTNMMGIEYSFSLHRLLIYFLLFLFLSLFSTRAMWWGNGEHWRGMNWNEINFSAFQFIDEHYLRVWFFFFYHERDCGQKQRGLLILKKLKIKDWTSKKGVWLEGFRSSGDWFLISIWASYPLTSQCFWVKRTRRHVSQPQLTSNHNFFIT